MKQAEKDIINKRYLIDQFEENVVRHPDKVFLIFEGREFSYGLVDHMANKVANVAAAIGLHQGDTVAVMMPNEPAFVWTFLGSVFCYLKINFGWRLIKGNVVNLEQNLSYCHICL